MQSLSAFDGTSQAKRKSRTSGSGRSRDIDGAEDVEEATGSNVLDYEITQ
jgi:hypothetical protein